MAWAWMAAQQRPVASSQQTTSSSTNWRHQYQPTMPRHPSFNLSWVNASARRNAPAAAVVYSSVDESQNHHHQQQHPQQNDDSGITSEDVNFSPDFPQAFDPDAMFAARPHPRPLMGPPPDDRVVRRRKFFASAITGAAAGIVYSGARALRNSGSPANIIMGGFIGALTTSLYSVILDPIERFFPLHVPFAAATTLAGSATGSIMASLLSRDRAVRKGLGARGFVFGSLLGLAHGIIAPYLEYDRVQRRMRSLQLLQPEDQEAVLETARQLGVQDPDRPWLWELSNRYPWLPIYFTQPGEKTWVHAETNPSRHMYAVDEATVPWLPNEGPRPAHIPPMFTPAEERFLEAKLGPGWCDRLQPPEFPDALIRELMDPAEVIREAERLLRLQGLGLPPSMQDGAAAASSPPSSGPASEPTPPVGAASVLGEDPQLAAAADAQRWERARERAARSADLARLGRELFTEHGDLREHPLEAPEHHGLHPSPAGDQELAQDERWRILGRLVSVPDLPRLPGNGIWN